MSTILIVLLLVIGVVVATSVALGRNAYEVESARDTEYLELEGAWIRYNVIGGGPPVLLIHGWLSSSRIWEQLAPRLAQRFTVYTLDLVGFGESDKPLSGYGVRNGSRLLYAFCAHFGLTRTGVIGHDLGGAMAVKLAADHPDIVGRLVLVAIPADEDQIDLPTALWLATLPVVGPIFYTLGRALGALRKLWMRPFVADPADLTEEVVEDAGRSTPAAVSQTLSISRREIARGRLARQARIIKTPMLLIAGEDDQIVDPQAVGVWGGSVDQAEVCLLDDCGHLPMIERTTEFNAQVLAFLTGDARYLEYVETPPASDSRPGTPKRTRRNPSRRTVRHAGVRLPSSPPGRRSIRYCQIRCRTTSTSNRAKIVLTKIVLTKIVPTYSASAAGVTRRRTEEKRIPSRLGATGDGATSVPGGPRRTRTSYHSCLRTSSTGPSRATNTDPANAPRPVIQRRASPTSPRSLPAPSAPARTW